MIDLMSQIETSLPRAVSPPRALSPPSADIDAQGCQSTWSTQELLTQELSHSGSPGSPRPISAPSARVGSPDELRDVASKRPVSAGSRSSFSKSNIPNWTNESALPTALPVFPLQNQPSDGLEKLPEATRHDVGVQSSPEREGARYDAISGLVTGQGFPSTWVVDQDGLDTVSSGITRLFTPETVKQTDAISAHPPPFSYRGSAQPAPPADAPRNLRHHVAPDFVLDPEGWFSFHDQRRIGLERAQFAEALRETYSHSSLDFVNVVVNMCYAGRGLHLTLEEFLRNDFRRNILTYLGEPPIKVGRRPVPHQGRELASTSSRQSLASTCVNITPRERLRRATETGRAVIRERDRFGKETVMPLPEDVVGMSLYVGNAALRLRDDIPTLVRDLLDAKGAMDIHRAFTDAMLKSYATEGQWKTEAMKAILKAYRPRFEQKQINIFICQAHSVEVLLCKWVELVDRNMKPTYTPRDRLSEGSEACAVM